MKSFVLCAMVSATLLLVGGDAPAGEKTSSFGGKAFFDYFIDSTDYEDDDQTATRGFQMRRVYFTLKQSWGDMTFRYTSDIDYKYGTGNLNIYSKYAYLQWKNLIEDASLYIGLHSPQSHGWIDKQWHYRSVAKTMSDANKWTHSAELGMSLVGKLMEGDFQYAVSVNNGNGYKDPVNKDGMGLAGRLAFSPVENLTISGLFTNNTEGTYDGVSGIEGSDEANTYIEGFAGYENDRLGFGGQYGLFTEAGLGTAKDIESSGMSLFGRVLLTEGAYAFGRYDIVDPNTDQDDDGENLLIVGLDYRAAKGLYLQPNLRIASFDDKDTDNETIIALTFYMKF